MYCKFVNFREGFFFVKIICEVSLNKTFAKWQNHSVVNIDIGKPCLSLEFFTSLICLLMLFTKIKFLRKFPNLQ